MEDKNLTTEESIALITKMIENTRRNFNDRGGVMFLVWGYTTIVVTAAVTALFLLTKSYDAMWLWWAIPVVGGLLTLRHFHRHQKPVHTYLDRTVGDVWIVFSAAVAGLMVYIFTLSFTSTVPCIDILFTISLMMSIATAITGRIIKFRPVVFGGFIGLGISYAISAVDGIIWQMSMFAAIFLVTQVIPGHMLNTTCKREVAANATAATTDTTKNGRTE